MSEAALIDTIKLEMSIESKTVKTCYSFLPEIWSCYAREHLGIDVDSAVKFQIILLKF